MSTTHGFLLRTAQELLNLLSCKGSSEYSAKNNLQIFTN